MVRVYSTESEGILHELLKYLHDESEVCGITVFRGITGFGKSGRVHAAKLLDISFDLPVVVEFFDEPARAASIIEHLNTLVKPGRIVFWQARLNA
jgi:PII-like signaling protein